MTRYERQDLVFAPDPFKSGSNPRPWLIISGDQMEFPGDMLCVACTKSSYPANYEITPDMVESGSLPDETTYCSPWLLATLKPTNFAFRQATMTKAFTNMIAQAAEQYVDTGN